jgi:MFS family permease
MQWALVIFALVGLGVGAMLATVRAISRATDERRHDRLSIRFWTLLAALGIVVAIAFVYPFVAQGWASNEAGRLVAALICVPPAFVTVVGLRNAGILLVAARRRHDAFAHGDRVEARIVDRSRRAFAHDIMSIVVEADLPVAAHVPDLAYRQRDPARTRVHRFVETCPTDHWARLEPGTTVSLRYVADAPERYAVEIFAPPSPAS